MSAVQLTDLRSHRFDLAHFDYRRLQSSIGVISAQGAIDATNAGALADFALGHMAGCRGMILDLRALDFFGTEGFCALHRISAGDTRGDTRWVVVPSRTVSRVLRICERQSALPATDTIEAALSTLQQQRGLPPNLVAVRPNLKRTG